MSEEFSLVSDLALILISAGIMTIIFKLLKQPLVLGYIVAGFIVGPHFDLFPTVIGSERIGEWSEIGIIFLLFALGLEFSFKKLFKVGGSAFVAAATEILAMMGIGFLTGLLLGFTEMESIFLGGMLAISSTTIIIKAFDDLKLRKQHFTEITMVILIIQDLVAIVMMVLLSSAAVSHTIAGKELFLLIAKLLFFLILWFVVGISVIPTFFRKAKKYINDETLLIISIGLCFGMVAFATYVGFSSALGAFVMGSILSETVEGKNIEHHIKSIKDLFGAVFFVSVGMMVDPKILVEHWDKVLIITFITIVVKGFISTGGVLIAGQSLKDSIKSGFSLAQIGEFSFIIASLGVTLNVMSGYIYPVIVAVSVITTFATPYCIRLANPCYKLLNRWLPNSFKEALDSYKLLGSAAKEESDWKFIIRVSLVRTVVFAIICFAINVLLFRFFFPWVDAQLLPLLPEFLLNLLKALFAILVMSPFLYGLMSNKQTTRDTYSRLWYSNRVNRIGIVSWSLFRIGVAAFFVLTVLSKLFKSYYFVLLLIAVVLVLFFLFSRRSLRYLARFEANFMQNLNARKTEGDEIEPEEEENDDEKS